MENRVFEGIVKWFSSRGESFGYIHRFTHEDGSNGECFVHYKGISEVGQENPKFKVLRKGQKVSFEIGPGFPSGKGTQAFKVKVLNDDSQRLGGTQAVLP